MARLILKSPYLKPGGQRSPGGYLKYIATRDGVEMAEDTSGHLPATAQQKKEISALLKERPDSRDSLEYLDFQENPTRRNAEEFLRVIHDFHADKPQRDGYLRYIGQRPGSNGLFTDEGVPIVLEQMLLQLSHKLSMVKGKKQYGYLNATTKKLVDDIVRELCKDSRIQVLYELWYEQKEDVLRTYTDKMPQRIPLEQQKEFKSIRNAVVQAAQQLSPTQEETPLSDPLSPCVDFVESSKETAPESAQSQPVASGEQSRSQTTSVALGLLRIFANMIHEDAGRHIRRQDFLDRKQRQKTAEKKMAQGQRISHDEPDNAMNLTM